VSSREQALLEEMISMRNQGIGVRRIAATLNAAGLPNPRTGGDWYYGTVAAVLRTAQQRRRASR